MAEEKHIHSLSYRVRIPVVLTYCGQLMFMVSILSLVTLLVALLTKQYTAALRYAIVIAGLGGLGYMAGRWERAADLRGNEALVITALAFLITPSTMAWPMTAAGIGYGDALFEAISAVTTTGLSTLSSVENRPFVFLFSRAWMQWIGGLGIVILTLAILARPGAASRRLAATEAEVEDLLGGTRSFARRVVIVYLILSVSGIVLMLATNMKPVDALLQTLTSVSTGGFSNHDNSLVSFSLLQQTVVTLFSTLGAVSLILFYKGFKKNIREFFGDFELRVFVLMCGASAIALTSAGVLFDGLTLKASIKVMPLTALSAQSTTGFAVSDLGALSAGSKLIMVCSMVMGGMIGSTAGGIKVFRLLVFARVVHLLIVRTSMPSHAIANPKLLGKELNPEETRNALLLILLFVLFIVVSWLPFLAMGHDAMDSLFDIVSSLGTVGLSAGVTGPHLEPLLKGVLGADMLLGRLEFIAFLVILYPTTWVGRRMQ